MFSIIVAIGKSGEIGKNNELLWNIPEDLKNFRKITNKKVVVMGRKTFESIGRLLPNRYNIVLSQTLEKKDFENLENETTKLEVCKTFEEVINKYKHSDEEIFIIGGEQIYKTSLEKGIIDKLYISYVDFSDSSADAYFPKINYADWEKEKEEVYDNWKFCVYKKNHK